VRQGPLRHSLWLVTQFPEKLLGTSLRYPFATHIRGELMLTVFLSLDRRRSCLSSDPSSVPFFPYLHTDRPWFRIFLW
jgi:hypothetical protein